MLELLGEANSAALIGLLGGIALGLAADDFARSARSRIFCTEQMIGGCACG